MPNHSENRQQKVPTSLQTHSGCWQLLRYPKRKYELLQAWDTADEFMLTAAEDNELAGPVLILNDSFGALALGLHELGGWTMSDSRVSLLGYEQNLQLNTDLITSPALAPLCMTDAIPPAASVVFKIPKSQSLLEYQLQRIAAELPAGTPIFAAAKSKVITPSVRELFQRYLADMKVSLAWKKSRVLGGTLQSPPADATEPALTSVWQVPEFELELSHQPGVFARKQLDIGARLLLDNLPTKAATDVTDLGCGNGVLGLAYARNNPQAKVTWVDESYLAVASVQENIAKNLAPAEGDTRYHAYVDDCLASADTNSADLILCNPPFHQEFSITEHVARQMFTDAKRVLRKGGELRVVGNRHLGYHQFLNTLFDQVEVIASNPKFVVFSAIK
ncbi:16S rRNA (guanine1207-N2)-methyltransferase/23S rRNA (guanine1835-N2)-methyltransferase [Pseudidiomarina planktonica]|uniref:16S rRNA (Guanine1207-N2)-methyltransferase/23S rRNA (Guanine1835-N2)-methyltransferase n=1 Tax=Pseudidiomarina planktonica TaxID=1323738 RepID=A0A1Y6F2T4_9GAMM|nr:methyltransferase [Pseudidiomarina planktonica]RUO64937.1 23S rRNA (guanine(1835)-N(2))-methyltransferase [Pseudidiomarina planktonica]SMQ69198.1 16S rRNA (guanine1207-N2)-methyltransferase/23S rRNA (guanine1835-N2)-methyltransferase [Pseudidiomarina planktonica]